MPIEDAKFRQRRAFALPFTIKVLFLIFFIFYFTFSVFAYVKVVNHEPSDSSINSVIERSQRIQITKKEQWARPRISREPWSHPIIHIVNTRFMQHQGYLEHLSRARLELFEGFCLPSMTGQLLTTQFLSERKNQTLAESSGQKEKAVDPYFVWIIKIDPNLNESIKNRMIKLLEPYPNFYLVGSNTNFGIGKQVGGWRGGQAGEEIFGDFTKYKNQDLNIERFNSKVYCGDLEILLRAHEYREERIVLETRLDADDGLNQNYLKMVQAHAISNLAPIPDPLNKIKEKKAKWMYWCAMNVIEWVPLDVQEQSTGHFFFKRYPYYCATPGLTSGSSVGLEEINIPRYQHDMLLRGVRTKGGCGFEEKRKCLKLVVNPIISAIRSRTVTSAGTKGIDLQRQKTQTTWPSDALRGFGLNRTLIQNLNSFLQSESSGIAQDNMRGQCTPHHSCKSSSLETLHKLYDISGKGKIMGIETVEVRL